MKNRYIFLNQVRVRPYSHKTFWHIILRYCDKKIILSHMFQWPTKVSSEKTYIDFLKSLPLPTEIYGPKIFFIAISFYRNIVCINVLCEWGLNLAKLCFTHFWHKAWPFHMFTNVNNTQTSENKNTSQISDLNFLKWFLISLKTENFIVIVGIFEQQMKINYFS